MSPDQFKRISSNQNHISNVKIIFTAKSSHILISQYFLIKPFQATKAISRGSGSSIYHKFPFLGHENIFIHKKEPWLGGTVHRPRQRLQLTYICIYKPNILESVQIEIGVVWPVFRQIINGHVEKHYQSQPTISQIEIGKCVKCVCGQIWPRIDLQIEPDRHQMISDVTPRIKVVSRGSDCRSIRQRADICCDTTIDDGINNSIWVKEYRHAM